MAMGTAEFEAALIAVANSVDAELAGQVADRLYQAGAEAAAASQALALWLTPPHGSANCRRSSTTGRAYPTTDRAAMYAVTSSRPSRGSPTAPGPASRAPSPARTSSSVPAAGRCSC